jgi:hypothetical protein
MCDDRRTDELQVFYKRETEWLQSVGRGEPVYCLPPEAIEQFAAVRGRRIPLIDGATASLEQQFWDVCRRANACGLYGDQPVFYPCLWEPYGLSPEQFKKILYPVYGEAFDAATLMEVHIASWDRLKGYAGWLVTDTEFIREREQLRSQWAQLPATAQPCPPFDQVAHLNASTILAIEEYCAKLSSKPSNSLPLTKIKMSFLEAMSEFLRRWNLCQLTTWDLPLPFGPLLADDLSRHSQAIPEHSVQLILPIHYPLTTSDTLLATIREKQKRVARQQGLNPQVAALQHYVSLGRMMQVQHIEHTIRSRYSGTGLVALIERAVAASLGLSIAQTAKLRKAISACRRGKRDKVPWLNARP